MINITIDKGARRQGRRNADAIKSLEKRFEKLERQLINEELRRIQHEVASQAYIKAKGVTREETMRILHDLSDSA